MEHSEKNDVIFIPVFDKTRYLHHECSECKGEWRYEQSGYGGTNFYDLDKMKKVITALANGETLEAKYRDHLLTGDYGGYRECHIQPDWLLVYQIEGEQLILFLARTGTHSDLF